MRNPFRRKQKDLTKIPDEQMASQTMTLYVVFDISTEKSKKAPIYYAHTKDQAARAVATYIFADAYDHYKAWCQDRFQGGFNVLKHGKPTSEAFSLYARTTGLLEEDNNPYRIAMATYTAAEITTILRSYSRSVPLGLAEESPTEFLEYISSHYSSFLGLSSSGSQEPKVMSVLIDTDPHYADNLGKASIKFATIFNEVLQNAVSELDTPEQNVTKEDTPDDEVQC